MLIKSLTGLNHKFLVILNKVDKLDSSVDFARAYGSLGWALSKVIKRKDIPQIYTMYNEGMQGHSGTTALPLKAFDLKRHEVIEEVMRVPQRHNDNIITNLEDTLRQAEMISTIVQLIRSRARARLARLQAWGATSILVPVVVAYQLWKVVAFHLAAQQAAEAEAAASLRGRRGHVIASPGPAQNEWELPSLEVCVFALLVYSLVSAGVLRFLWAYFLQYQRELFLNLDSLFEEAYADYFVHNDGEDLRSRWQIVRPKLAGILLATPLFMVLPTIDQWEIQRMKEVQAKDMWYLRQLARKLRQEPAAAK